MPKVLEDIGIDFNRRAISRRKNRLMREEVVRRTDAEAEHQKRCDCGQRLLISRVRSSLSCLATSTAALESRLYSNPVFLPLQGADRVIRIRTKLSKLVRSPVDLRSLRLEFFRLNVDL